jgi:phosphate starvation-inducible protein PhoH
MPRSRQKPFAEEQPSPKKKVSKNSKQYKSQTNGLSLKVIKPKTYTQTQVFESFYENHLLLQGSPGTGKSFISLYLALREILEFGHTSKFKKIILIRSAVQTRDIGFMPGTLSEKISYYELPYKDIVNDLCGRGDAYDVLKQKGVIEFMCTSFVRGLTLDDAIIIVDEAQNNTAHELDSVITRVGDNSKIIFCGDFYQSDLKGTDKNGFKAFVEVISRISGIERIEFTSADIVRSNFVKAYIIAREESKLVL